MKIKAAGAAQKNQAQQVVNPALEAAGDTNAQFSLRQEFQAALENFAGRGMIQNNSASIDLSTFEAPALVIAPRTIERSGELAKSADTLNKTPERNAFASDNDTERDLRDSADPDRRAPDLQGKTAEEEQISESIVEPKPAPSEIAQSDNDAAVNVVVAGAAASPLVKPAASAEVPEDALPTTQQPLAAQLAPESSPQGASQKGGSQVASGSNRDAVAQAQVSNDSGAPEAVLPVETAPVGTSLTKTAASSESIDNNAKNQLDIAAQKITADTSIAAFSAAIAGAVAARLGGSAQNGAGHEAANHNGPNALNSLEKANGNSTQSLTAIRAETNAKAELARNAETQARPARFQPSKLLERVEATLKEAAKSRDGKTISFRLDPPELGSLKVDVSIRDGALHARISAENSQVANVVRERAHELQSMLRKLGLAVEKVSISVHESAQNLGGEFSQSFTNNGNSSSSQNNRSRDFNNFSSGSGIALQTQSTQQADTPRVNTNGSGLIGINNGWVA